MKHPTGTERIRSLHRLAPYEHPPSRVVKWLSKWKEPVDLLTNAIESIQVGVEDYQFYLTRSHRPIFTCFVCIRRSPVAARDPHLQSIVQQKFSKNCQPCRTLTRRCQQ